MNRHPLLTALLLLAIFISGCSHTKYIDTSSVISESDWASLKNGDEVHIFAKNQDVIFMTITETGAEFVEGEVSRKNEEWISVKNARITKAEIDSIIKLEHRSETKVAKSIIEFIEGTVMVVSFALAPVAGFAAVVK